MSFLVAVIFREPGQACDHKPLSSELSNLGLERSLKTTNEWRHLRTLHRIRRGVRDVTKRGTFAMESNGSCPRYWTVSSRRGFELFFKDCEHPLHPHYGAAFLRRLSEAREDPGDELLVLDRRRRISPASYEQTERVWSYRTV